MKAGYAPRMQSESEDGGRIVAAIDIGTNSVKITVGRRTARGVEVLLDRVEMTRLGKGVDAGGRLSDEAIHRTLTALASFGQDARNLRSERIAAVGTSALRDAANGAEFVARAERDLGGSVEVISGDREADLTYAAARHDPDLGLPSDPDTVLVTIDIGGGSTEIVVGRGDVREFRRSLQIGAVRLTERALPSDPPTTAERGDAARIADDILSVVPVPAGGRVVVVGSGGTVASLAAMDLMEENPGATVTPDALHGRRLSVGQIESRIERLSAVPLAKRKATPGLEPARADVILAGAILQARVLRRLGATDLTVSARGLRFGLLYELLG